MPGKIQEKRSSWSTHADSRFNEEAQMSVSRILGLHERIFTSRQTQETFTYSQQYQALQLQPL